MTCDVKVSAGPDRRVGTARLLLLIVASGLRRSCGGLAAGRGRTLVPIAIVARKTRQLARACEATRNHGAKFRKLVERAHGYLEFFGRTAVSATQRTFVDSLCKASSVSAFGQ
jgi:hypothetical protein